MRRPLAIVGTLFAGTLVAAGSAAAEITVAVARITEGALWVIGQERAMTAADERSR
jgi:hypothetical protein